MRDYKMLAIIDLDHVRVYEVFLRFSVSRGTRRARAAVLIFIDVSSVAGALSYNRNNNLRKPRKESKYCDRHRGRPPVSRAS